jgi:hypothetical protein
MGVFLGRPASVRERIERLTRQSRAARSVIRRRATLQAALAAMLSDGGSDTGKTQPPMDETNRSSQPPV